MSTHPPRLSAGIPLAACLLPSPAPAQEAPRPNPPPEDQALRKVSGIFDTDLPKTEKKGRIRFIVHPHFGDFTRRPYVRVPVGVRWGVNDHVELSATVEPHFEHSLRSGSPGNGLSDVELGGKYAFHQWLKPDYDASVGANLRFPVDHPPPDMTDGYNQYAPYFVVARQSPRIEGLKCFASTTLDYMDKSHVAGTFRRNDPHSSNVTFGTGFVLDRYPYHYTLETGYQTTSVIGRDNKQFVYIRPGFAWDVPRRFTFDSHGRWLVGFSFKVTKGPDGTRIDSGGKIRGEFSLRRWFGGKPC